jgi:hypothetical protein
MCKKIEPEYDELPSIYPNVVFLKCDVDKNKQVARTEGIGSMPTFHFYKNKQRVGVVLGAQYPKLEATIKRFSKTKGKKIAEDAGTLSSNFALIIIVDKYTENKIQIGSNDASMKLDVFLQNHILFKDSSRSEIAQMLGNFFSYFSHSFRTRKWRYISSRQFPNYEKLQLQITN